MTTTKKTTKKTAKDKKGKPKRLSKAGKWSLMHPNGIGEIIDLEAVLQ
jgi:hypothetical protein